MIKKPCCLILCALLPLSLCGCGGTSADEIKWAQPGEKEPSGYERYDYTATHSATNNFVTFASSDEKLAGFLNDYAERHMRDTKNRVGTQSVGGSTRPPWREWDSLIGSWWDASNTNDTMTRTYAANDFLNDWLVRGLQDNQGYVWTDNNAEQGVLFTDWGMGWDFPKVSPHGGKAWEFTKASDLADWQITGATASQRLDGANTFLDLAATNTGSITLTTENFNVLTKITPFLRLGLAFVGSGNYEIDDLYVSYKTSENAGWSEKVPFSTFCTTGHKIGNGMITRGNYYFPMYLLDGWGAHFNGEHADRRITGLKIELAAKAGTTFSGTLSVDYVSSQYDDRQMINPCNYVIAAKNLLEFSRDGELLKTVLPRARAAMNYLLHQGNGASGLVSTQYHVGHFNTGTRSTAAEFNEADRGIGIGDGYWDVDAFPTVNMYVNLSYYTALCDMIYLEDMAKGLGLSEYNGTVETANAQMSGVESYTTATAESLPALRDLCKQRFTEEFWNEKTGRFHAGHYDGNYDGVQDHGYVLFNQQAIVNGLASAEQTASILSWINGERTVAGDNSTGADIYRYEIAPRFNTHDIDRDFAFVYWVKWDGNVQNGGTALHLAYYDIVAQSRLSTQKAYGRLTALKEWYEKVQAAGGEGLNFYREYYKGSDVKLQGGKDETGKDQNGLVGVDYEFIEAAVLIRAIPDAFFGLGTLANETLCFAPNVPDGLGYLRLENLVYDGYYYDVSAGKYFLEISNVRNYGRANGSETARLQVSFPIPSFDFTVEIDGKATKAYTVNADGTLTVTAPFANAKVEIKEKA